jgi:hypothetical protein
MPVVIKHELSRLPIIYKVTILMSDMLFLSVFFLLQSGVHWGHGPYAGQSLVISFLLCFGALFVEVLYGRVLCHMHDVNRYKRISAERDCVSVKVVGCSAQTAM